MRRYAKLSCRGFLPWQSVSIMLFWICPQNVLSQVEFNAFQKQLTWRRVFGNEQEGSPCEDDAPCGKDTLQGIIHLKAHPLTRLQASAFKPRRVTQQAPQHFIEIETNFVFNLEINSEKLGLWVPLFMPHDPTGIPTVINPSHVCSAQSKRRFESSCLRYVCCVTRYITNVTEFDVII